VSVQLVSKISDLCDRDPPTSQTDRRTDRRTTCDRNTALCTKVHRAVKTIVNLSINQFICREISHKQDYKIFFYIA